MYGEADGRLRALRLDFQTVHKTPINALKAFQIPGNEMKAGRWTMLASADINGTIILWEMNTDGPKLLHTVTGQNRSITNLSMHPSDQKLLVSGSYDGSIRLLDVESGAQILTCELEDRDERMRSFTASNGRVHTFKEGVSSMVVTLDGTIISGGWSGFVRVWKASTG
jgi:WD40 repeat protein